MSRGRRANSRRSWRRPSQHIAGVDVDDRQCEKDQPNRQYSNVHHGSAPKYSLGSGFFRAQDPIGANKTSCDGIRLGRRSKAPEFLPFSRPNSCHASHMNSRGRRPKTYRNLIKTGCERVSGTWPKSLNPLLIGPQFLASSTSVMENQSSGMELRQSPNRKNRKNRDDRHKSQKLGASLVGLNDFRDPHRNQHGCGQ
jgi:hypothetical protein